MTDITYLTYKKGKIDYLSTIKDLSTNEILAHYTKQSTVRYCFKYTGKVKLNINLKRYREAILHAYKVVYSTIHKLQIK